MGGTTAMNFYRDMDEQDAMQAFETLLDDAEQAAINPAEMSFVSDMTSRFQTYGLRALVSEKQFQWLERIAGYEETKEEQEEFRGD